ncbi:Gfo/Idh/MocA family oxidoreductase [Lentisphaerota bacterium WC36G]|nr:Gfo/Idh/MocA family oxidoreductase [Lentisphaerae bacterium WC36]
MKRREFLRTASMAAGAVALSGCQSQGAILGGISQTNMAKFTAKPLNKIRVGIVGLGNRGTGAVSRLSKIRDVEIVALCDLNQSFVERAQKVLTKSKRPKAQYEFSGSPEAWRKMCDLDIELIYNCTSWDYHTPISVEAMKKGKHAAVEVPAGKTLDELWELVETSEKYQRHCMMLENTCYDFFELLTLRMAREGAFGEITHAEGAYIHQLCRMIQGDSYQNKWRFKENMAQNGNLYPTHGLGPVAQCMNINRENLFDYMTSMSTNEFAFRDYAKQNNHAQYQDVVGYRGDMNTSLLHTVKGQTVMIQHDVSTPRPYSRIHLLQGTRGCAQKYPGPAKIALDSYKHGHQWLPSKKFREVCKKYEHPLIKTMGKVARKVGGHGGMDFIMDYRLIYCLKHGLPLDQNVYDAATWSAVMPLSAMSIKKRSNSIEFPDFTRGMWKNTKPWPIVDVEPAKLPLFDIKRAENQLHV